MTTEVKLTQYSKGGGCGCKIAPSVLQQILQTQNKTPYQNLLVGNESADDAAVYKVSDDLAVISTTDFFMPIVNDAFDFGRIASANAISDIYAMGGTPLMAIAILGWPVDKLSADVAQQVLEGARAICKEANIPLAGGHTIDSSDPIFGLAVTGTCSLKHLKQNNQAKEGDYLFLTKPVGVGIISTSVKRELLQPEHYPALVKQLTTLNKAGEALGKIEGVHAMTDVTGFGLMGHLIEMAEGSGLSADLSYNSVRKMDALDTYLQQRTIPGATARNWKSYGHKVQFEEGIDEAQATLILPDPQTNGGLLIAVSEDSIDAVKAILQENNISLLEPIGRLIQQKEKIVYVKP